jgi:hypothetical protein
MHCAAAVAAATVTLLLLLLPLLPLLLPISIASASQLSQALQHHGSLASHSQLGTRSAAHQLHSL